MDTMLRQKLTLTLTLILLCLAAPAHAQVYFDFTSGGVTSGSSFGNSITFTSGDVTLKATSWADTGANDTFESARIRSWASYGLGSCNRNEGSNCSNPEHQFDNYGDHDYALFVLTGGTSEVLFNTITLDPYNTWDRDVSFWIGTIDPGLDLTGYDKMDLAMLGFGAQMDVFNSRSSAAIEIALNNISGNALLIAPNADQTSTYYRHVDRFKITGLEAEEMARVPEPATMFLFGGGLLGGALIRKRRPGLTVES